MITNIQKLRDSIDNMLRETILRGDTLAPGWREEIFAIARNIVLDEREACAKVCEEISGNEPSGDRFGALDCAEYIRARSIHCNEINLYKPKALL